MKKAAIGPITSPTVFPAINSTSANWNIYTPSITTVTPNISWQNTSSGATYSSAANLLTTC